MLKLTGWRSGGAFEDGMPSGLHGLMASIPLLECTGQMTVRSCLWAAKPLRPIRGPEMGKSQGLITPEGKNRGATSLLRHPYLMRRGSCLCGNSKGCWGQAEVLKTTRMGMLMNSQQSDFLKEKEPEAFWYVCASGDPGDMRIP